MPQDTPQRPTSLETALGGMLQDIGKFMQRAHDELRQGFNIQKKQSIDEGSTRTLCRSAGLGGAVPISFGWLLRKPEVN